MTCKMRLSPVDFQNFSISDSESIIWQDSSLDTAKYLQKTTPMKTLMLLCNHRNRQSFD
jgi:hypothetical protein